MANRSGLRLFLHRLHLLACAWRLHRVAQRLGRDEPLAATREAMLEQPFLPRNTEPDDALWAARWAALVGRRLFRQLDTCLVRSLVAGVLVADGPGVAVRIGVHRPQRQGDLLDAHAWLTVSDREVAPANEAGANFEQILVLPVERG